MNGLLAFENGGAAVRTAVRLCITMGGCEICVLGSLIRPKMSEQFVL